MFINYIHDKAERKDLLDGTGEGFPTPNAADPEPKSPESNSRVQRSFLHDRPGQGRIYNKR